MAVKPTTQRDVIDEIYYGMYGTDGSIGIVGRMRQLEEDFKTHAAWHIGHRTTIIVAACGWVVAVVVGVAVVIGG